MNKVVTVSTGDRPTLLVIEATLRLQAKRVETYRMAKDAESDELDSIFQELLEQADQICMIAQPIRVSFPAAKNKGTLR